MRSSIDPDKSESNERWGSPKWFVEAARCSFGGFDDGLCWFERANEDGLGEK